jgi:hypothetical protein
LPNSPNRIVELLHEPSAHLAFAMLAQPIPLPSGYLLGGETGISIAFESDGRWTEIADLKFRHEENCRLPACPDGPASPRFPYRRSGNLHGRYPLVCRADYPLETVTRAQTEGSSQRVFMEHDQMIEAPASNGADHAFYIGTLPRRARCRQNFADPKSRD